jgi:hypothetical protein
MGRQNADQPRTLSPLGEDFFDPILLPHIPLAEEFDLDPVIRCQSLGVLAQCTPERFGELGLVEDPDLPFVRIRCHALSKTDLRQRAKQQDPVPAGEHPSDLRRVAFRQQCQAHSGMILKTGLFGSAYAGLGMERWDRRWCGQAP